MPSQPFVVQLSSCKTISYRLLNLNYCMDSRFLCSEEQVVHFPLTTSPRHQLSRNLLHSAALYFAPIFTPVGLLGMCLWALVCREAGSGTHKDCNCTEQYVWAALCSSRHTEAGNVEQVFKMDLGVHCSIRTAEGILSTPANLFAFLLLSTD